MFLTYIWTYLSWQQYAGCYLLWVFFVTAAIIVSNENASFKRHWMNFVLVLFGPVTLLFFLFRCLKRKFKA